ncbi:nuclear matrix protein [Aspergillus sclerotialis]|uniref:Nuclear matrix protein n=1 Tax=Aspergillus sclerotialis TaxID=2070753 RepID=A0A3A2ZYH5_9EURO|nr:nuclear matrix protein [Aspergillus sclerotialis]
MATFDIDLVNIYRKHIDLVLKRAENAKPDQKIEPPLSETHLGDAPWLVQEDDQPIVNSSNQQTQTAAVEIAFREKFYSILATTSIDDPTFIQIWNLLDIISIFSDNEQCEPGLIFWLIEELLDSQTIDGCRKVFDYLESRRERNTKVCILSRSGVHVRPLTLVKKHFKQKSLIILRSCNELLRRLSRAEDTVFCGRVFIFLFQSFPLGDKSAVNLRGEYHTENVTTYDDISKEPVEEKDAMDVDISDEKKPATNEEQKPEDAQATSGEDSQEVKQNGSKPPHIAVPKDEKDKDRAVDLDTLYPMFWGLQAYFSSPTKMFDPQHFATFKTGLESTLSAFKSMNTEVETQNTSRGSEDRKSAKRKRTADGAEIASSFNPKYLTSRDLFDLEVNDTAFRRHVLVQALILLDFMLSLTPKAKARLSDMTNKSVLYGFVLSEDDAKWAMKMRKTIEEYLQQGAGGKFYYRMVDTVLSRDKNWVRWKAEGCPLIERPPVSVAEYLGAREHATKAYANKRLRPSPMGSLDLKFLSEGESLANLQRLKEQERFATPAADSFMMGIMDDDLDIDMAQSKEDKESALRAKASKTWRILRLSSREKLSEFDKIEDGKNLKVLFEQPRASEGAKASTEGENDGENAHETGEKANTTGGQTPVDSNSQETGAVETTAT